ncbi:MAG TPA: ester cyclase [Acidisarcina sp.]
MKGVATDTRQFFENYIRAISGKPKTRELVREFVADSALEGHILQVEASFPSYEVAVHDLVVEGELVALRGTFHGVHSGTFAGIEPTGREVSEDVMIFYRIVDDRIRQFWMQMDMGALVSKLSGS